MTETPHIHLAADQADPPASTAADLAALAESLRQHDLAAVVVVVEQIEQIVETLVKVGDAIGMLSQCDDARIDDIRKLNARVMVLEQLAIVRDTVEHSRRVDPE